MPNTTMVSVGSCDAEKVGGVHVTGARAEREEKASTASTTRSPLRATMPVSAKPMVIARKAQTEASVSTMTPAASPSAPTSVQM